MSTGKPKRMSIKVTEEFAELISKDPATFFKPGDPKSKPDVRYKAMKSALIELARERTESSDKSFVHSSASDRIFRIITELAREGGDDAPARRAEADGLRAESAQLIERCANLEKALQKQRLMAQNFFECLILAGGGEPPPR